MRGSCWTGAPLHLTSLVFVLRFALLWIQSARGERRRDSPLPLLLDITMPASRLPSILRVAIYRDSESNLFPVPSTGLKPSIRLGKFARVIIAINRRQCVMRHATCNRDKQDLGDRLKAKLDTFWATKCVWDFIELWNTSHILFLHKSYVVKSRKIFNFSVSETPGNRTPFFWLSYLFCSNMTSRGRFGRSRCGSEYFAVPSTFDIRRLCA